MFVGSSFINVCSATGAMAPGYLPKNLPRETDDPFLCHVNTWTSYTGVNPCSGGMYDKWEIAQDLGFGTPQAMMRARSKSPLIQSVVHVTGDGRYNLVAAYQSSLDGIADSVQREARNNQLLPLANYWPISRS